MVCDHAMLAHIGLEIWVLPSYFGLRAVVVRYRWHELMGCVRCADKDELGCEYSRKINMTQTAQCSDGINYPLIINS